MWWVLVWWKYGCGLGCTAQFVCIDDGGAGCRCGTRANRSTLPARRPVWPISICHWCMLRLLRSQDSLTVERVWLLEVFREVENAISVCISCLLRSGVLFICSQESLTLERLRLLEVFREVDKDGDGALCWSQLYRLVLRLVPDAHPAHVRYVQLLLDRTGDNRWVRGRCISVRVCLRVGECLWVAAAGQDGRQQVGAWACVLAWMWVGVRCGAACR